MTLKSAPYYWVVCDGCGMSAQESSDYAAWAQSDMAENEAAESGWYLASHDDDDPQDGDYCEDCARKRGIWSCEGCGDYRRIVHTDDDLRWCATCNAANMADGSAS